MKFEIKLQDGMIIYANDICIFGPGCRRVGIWAHGEEIDSIDIDKVHEIWALFPDHNILIFV